MPIVRIERLKVGMQVEDDVFSPYGSILVHAGELLDERALEKLKLHNVNIVKILKESIKSDSTSDLPTITPTINPEVLTQFTETYTNKTEEVKNIFNQISEDQNVGIEENLSEITLELIDSIGNQNDILKYMSKMKKAVPSLYTHCINVSILCNMFATLLDFPKKKKEELTIAGLLHDIGKAELGIDIEHNTLNMSNLTSDNLEEYKKHTTLSYRILSGKGFSKNICLGVLMHHETVQGEGFPTGAQWDQIHEFAKIIAIANYYDHITFSGNTRHEVNPFTIIKILEEIQYNKFDIKFVNTFLKRIATYHQNEWVELTSNEVGQIVFINPHDLAHPIVKIGNTMVDLSTERDIEIKHIL